MNRHELEQYLVSTFGGSDPERSVMVARNAVVEAECAVKEIDETLNSFDQGAVYRTGQYEGGQRYWQKCETRRTKKCYFATTDHGRTRRFRREDVEADKIQTEWYDGYHLGRVIYQELLSERQRRSEHLEASRSELRLIEDQIAQGRPAVGHLEAVIERLADQLMRAAKRPGDKPDWREGF